MQQIAQWLEKLGLSEYAQRFAENGIDVSVLRHLTDQDLKDIGVLLGHRRKMLAAICELAGAAPLLADTAERRQVTVMFSDLVGSTALSARMDPEDLREVISSYQKCVAETVRRFDGFVAKYMGDGVLVYFGYPHAHEDDAERAVRAGLEMIASVSALASPISLQTRVGIATGLVVVGDLIGLCPGARHRRRDAQSGGAPAGNSRAEHGGYRREHTKASRQSLRAAGARGKRAQGHCRIGARLGRAAGKFRRKSLRGAARERPDCPGRPGRRIRTAAATLGKSKERRRPGGASLRRGRHWQIAAHGCAFGAPCRRASHSPALFLFSAAYRQCALSPHPPDGTCRRTCARRLAASEARQARRTARADFDVSPRRGTLCRNAVAHERWPLSGDRADAAATPPTNAGSAQCANGGVNASESGANNLRGRALDRRDDSGSARSGDGPDSDLARVADRDVSAGIRSTLDRPALRGRPHHQSAGSARHRHHD